MHIAVSWQIHATDARQTAIDLLLREGFKGYSWLRPIPNYYVVKVGGEPDRQAIQANLVAIAKGVPEVVHYVLTPLIPVGRYTGLLPKDTWPKLNERTD